MLRSKMTVRSVLVESRTKCINATKGILRGFGYRVTGGAHRTFSARVGKAKLPEELRETVQPLVEEVEALTERIESQEKELERIAAELPVVQHLRSIPGVGLIVALYYVLTIDNPERFRKSRDVAAFFGLRPSMRSSASVRHYGRITKEGDPEMRRLLVQAAHGVMRSRATCELQRWALQLAARRGKAKALVALARKLAVLMHRLWVTGEVFQPHPESKAA